MTHESDPDHDSDAITIAEFFLSSSQAFWSAGHLYLKRGNPTTTRMTPVRVPRFFSFAVDARSIPTFLLHAALRL
ncbi:MAG: hypothetical protein AAFU85_08015 [Planctomycetota bacterium]